MNLMKRSLKRNNIDSFSAHHDIKYGSSLTKTIQDAIEESDVIVAIITKDNPSQSVAQEVGFALKADIPVIPFVEEGANVGFMLGDIAQMRFTQTTVEKACEKVANYIDKELEENEEEYEEEELVNEQKMIERHDYEVYSYRFQSGDLLSGKISSDLPVNVFILDNRNFNLLEDADGFDYEDGSENVTRYTINFPVPKSKDWNLVIENNNSTRVNVDVRLVIS